MREALGWVEERGENLRIASEGLLEEQAHLVRQSSALQLRLSYFTYLEQAQRILHSPGEDLVLSEGFLGMVETLDRCLTYLRDHRDFKDAEIYLIRYQQCMTRSMTLIKMYFITAVRNLVTDVSRRIGERGSLSETATLALLYTKFTSFAFPLRPLLSELEKRAAENPSELGSLLDECHSTWVAVRKSLIGGRVEREIKRMEPNVTEIVELTRSGCSYLKQTCTEEFNLYKQFFQTGEDKLYTFMEGLCDYLYDYLRPRILHETSLTVLCEICTILQALMVREVGPDDNDEFAILDDPSTPVQHPTSPGGGGHSEKIQRSESFEAEMNIQPHRPTHRLRVGYLLRMVLRDAQTSLVFRSQALIRSDVELYTPEDDDLDYPGKIQRASSHLSSSGPRERIVSLDESDDEDPDYFALPSKETQETWYPTLRSTLWVLSCLHNYVEPNVFEDIAQEAISVCRQSLSSAAEIIAAKPTSSTTHGNLFLVRHLLILKEMTASVDLVRRDRTNQVDVGMIAALSTLLANALYMVGAGGLLGINPRRVTNVMDAKADVDRELKRVCEDLISQCAADATAPAKAFLDRCTLHLSSQTAGKSGELASQPWATPDKVMEVHEAVKVACEKKVPEWIDSLKLYLQDEATVKVLIPPLQSSLLDNYRAFYDVVRAEYEFTTYSNLTTPSAMHAVLKRLEADAFRVIA